MNEQTRLKLLGTLIELLQDKTDGGRRPTLYKRPGNDLNHLWAHFYKKGKGNKKGKEITYLDAMHALDCLMNNIYHFEDFDLTEAEFVELQVH